MYIYVHVASYNKVEQAYSILYWQDFCVDVHCTVSLWCEGILEWLHVLLWNKVQAIPGHLHHQIQNVHHLGSTSHSSQSWCGSVKQHQKKNKTLYNIIQKTYMKLYWIWHGLDNIIQQASLWSFHHYDYWLHCNTSLRSAGVYGKIHYIYNCIYMYQELFL